MERKGGVGKGEKGLPPFVYPKYATDGGVATRWTGVDMSTHFCQSVFLGLTQIR